MTHRAEQVMDAVVTAVTGLTTTGANVFRGREHGERMDGNLPALLIHLGPDTPDEEESSFPRLYSELTVAIEAVLAAGADYEATLLKIREEVTVALRSDYTLGLSFVQNTIEGRAEQPQPADEQGRRFSYPMNWTVRYSRSWDDPGA